MSANVFTAFAFPHRSKMGPPEVCGTEFFPVGFTELELMELIWTTKLVNVTPSGSVSGGGSSLALAAATINPSGGVNRQDLVRGLVWDFPIGDTRDGEPGTVSNANSVLLFNSGGYAYAFDGEELFYPSIVIAGSITAAGSEGNSASVSWDSRVDSSTGPFTSSAFLMGKTIPLRWDRSEDGDGAGSFGGISISKNSDWPYV